MEVAPATGSPNAHFLQVDPYPLLQTGNAGNGSCDHLPRIEVTSPGPTSIQPFFAQNLKKYDNVG